MLPFSAISRLAAAEKRALSAASSSSVVRLAASASHVASGHDEPVFAVLEVRDLGRFIAVFGHERQPAMEGVDDAEADGARQAVDVGGREQVEPLVAVDGAQFEHVRAAHALQHSVGVRPDEHQAHVGSVHQLERGEQPVDPLALLEASHADDVLRSW